jgi:arylsulfatase A-like enzyme
VLAAKQPNILVLFVDDLGWADVSYQGDLYDTPNIDKFASRSMMFSRAYIATPTCSPSRSSVLTGQHPARLRIVRHIPGGEKYGFDKFGRTNSHWHVLDTDPAQFESRNWLPLEVTTIAEALKPLGYYSAFMGKWHLGHEPFHPVHQGFDEQRGVSNFGHPKNYYQPFFVEGANPYADTPKEKYLTDRLTDDAVDFLKTYRRDKPFLLTVFFYNVHSPHQGRKDLIEKYEERGLEGRQANYGAMVEAMDDNVGRILRTLDEQGQADDTVVVFFSDQGGYFTQAPLRGGKTGGMALYEGGAKVPLAIRWPGQTKAGSKSDTLVLSTDLFPTFVEMAGGDPSAFKPLDGLSITPLLKGRKSIGRDELYLYRNYEDKYAAVVGKEWKLIAGLGGKHELYNLRTDPSETNDLAKTNPAKLKELLGRLEAWKKHVGVDPKVVAE